MTTHRNANALELRDRMPSRDQLSLELLQRLSERQKRIPPKYFYDERGSRLFDQICELPEYYPTRTELAILESHGEEIAAAIGGEAVLIEFGSGASTKTRVLLDHLPRLAAYVPVDISRSYLLGCARILAAEYPALHIVPVCADFTTAFVLPRELTEHARRVIYFPGSTLGNFERQDAIALLRNMRAVAGDGGAAVIGVDMVKSTSILEAAYNDSAGITAAFNRNVLVRLNREFGADFDLKAFDHAAPWVEAEGRIEMRLVSTGPQRVRIAGNEIEFEAGEYILTECCHKYTPEGFEALATAGGWTVARHWTDSSGWFRVYELEP